MTLPDRCSCPNCGEYSFTAEVTNAHVSATVVPNDSTGGLTVECEGDIIINTIDTLHCRRCKSVSRIVDESLVLVDEDSEASEQVTVPKEDLAQVLEFVSADPALDHPPEDSPVPDAIAALEAELAEEECTPRAD